MNDLTPFCTVPFAEAFTGSKSAFRNCCAADPQIQSLPNQSFLEWQKDPRLTKFRESMYTNEWPTECYRCQIQETQSGSSFRTAVNRAVKIDKNFGVWPSRWNLVFGNICNLACWTCNEQSSSVIMQHKKNINILPADFVDPEEIFNQQWDLLEQDILKSYDYHDVVLLTILGGEPLYNKTVSEFLNKLKNLGLSSRTRLEFHTNGTKINKKLFLKNTWNYVCVFLSLDAVGKKAEWLRYGCRWDEIESNIEFFKSVSDYIEVHCTLSILNINDLPALSSFCQSVDLALKIMTLSNPYFMSILNWNGDKNKITDRDQLESHGFEYYYDLIGTTPKIDSVQKLDQYISQFTPIRKSLVEYDTQLFDAIRSH